MKLALVPAVLAVASAAALATSVGAAAPTQTLTGAGSSFVFPLVSEWIEPLRNQGTTLSYDPSGSGEGVAAIIARTVDFAATDAPLTQSQRVACKGCAQIPWALSATAVTYNLPGVRSGLRLSGPVVAQMFLGTIRRWNASAIRRLNPGIPLPDVPVTPVHRSDTSGTTFSFTQYLAAVSPAFGRRVGVGTLLRWPAGLEAEGSSGVVTQVTALEGAVTYVNVAEALKNRLKIASVANAAGRWTVPGLRAIDAAAATVPTVPPGGQLTIVNPPRTAPTAYPISTFTYVIVPLASAKADALRAFLAWALTDGQRYGPPLLFQPVPQVVREYATTQIARIGRTGT